MTNTLSRLDEYLQRAPIKVHVALTAATVITTLAIASYTQPAAKAQVSPSWTAPITDQGPIGPHGEFTSQRADQIAPERTAQIVMQKASSLVSGEPEYSAEIERLGPMPKVEVDSPKTISDMNERTSAVLRDLYEIASRFDQSRSWNGSSFSPEQKAKNIAAAFVYSQLKAGHPEVKNLDNFMVKLREDTPNNHILNNVIADLNFKREIVREATIELGLLAAAVKDNNAEKTEFYRDRMENILEDAGYALSANTDWSLNTGKTLYR